MKRILIILIGLCPMLVWAEPRPIRVGLLLPLQADNAQRDKNMDRFANFYTGALLAVYEMQQTGQKVEVYTYDVGKSVQQLQKALQSPMLSTVDMIIGPAYPVQIPMMAEWALQKNIYTLLPFSSSVMELKYNPYLLQFNPSVTNESAVVAKRLASQENRVCCIFVAADDASIPESVREMQQALKEEGISYSYTSVEQIMNDSLSSILEDSVENVLLLNTERYANIRAIMPQLARAGQTKQLTLISRYAWQDEPIHIPEIYCSIFNEEENIDAVHYLSLYNRFMVEPHKMAHPCYDWIGYDLMNYVMQTVLAFHQFEGEWNKEEIITRLYHGLQSDVHFERVDEIGGYHNTNLHIVRK